MVVISQDGSVTIPYERFVFSTYDKNKIIATPDVVVRPSEIHYRVIGTYNDEEEAKMVLEYMATAFGMGNKVLYMPDSTE